MCDKDNDIKNDSHIRSHTNPRSSIRIDLLTTGHPTYIPTWEPNRMRKKEHILGHITEDNLHTVFRPPILSLLSLNILVIYNL